MKTSARLILILTIAVGVVMSAGGYFILRQREKALEEAMRSEVRAHAITLRIALERLYRVGKQTDAQELIDRMSDNQRIYGVVLFSNDGQVTMVSDELVADEIKFPSALALCFIASAETLLSAAAVDRLHQGERTKYNRELFAQGIGNALCGLVGALPMTGVIVRSKTNVEAGAKTRLSAILHGVWVLVMVALAPSLLSKIPTTALAAVLVYTGFKLVSPKAVRELKPYGKAEVAIYFATLAGIVTTNLLAGVLIGLGLALLKLFYKFSHLEVRLHTETASNVTTVSLNGAATFIRLPRLAAALESIPAGTKVNLEIDQLSYIDHACLDLIANWRKQHIARDGHAYVPWEDLHQRYQERELASQAQSGIALVKAAGD
jgi:MFS superfamily sulfate permease-like transporter